MISSNCFVIITSVNHAPPFWGELRCSPTPRPSEVERLFSFVSRNL